MDISYLLGALIVGLVAGFLARALMPGRDSMGLVATIILGLIGSFLGSILFGLIGIGDTDRFDIGGIIGAIIGALIVLGIYNAVTGRKHHGGGRVAHR
jgi:uncharacterized membrane protein YeaQ/YmgE (transglycosylase-associated protein family)